MKTLPKTLRDLPSQQGNIITDMIEFGKEHPLISGTIMIIIIRFIFNI